MSFACYNWSSVSHLAWPGSSFADVKSQAGVSPSAKSSGPHRLSVVQAREFFGPRAMRMSRGGRSCSMSACCSKSLDHHLHPDFKHHLCSASSLATYIANCRLRVCLLHVCLPSPSRVQYGARHNVVVSVLEIGCVDFVSTVQRVILVSCTVASRICSK